MTLTLPPPERLRRATMKAGLGMGSAGAVVVANAFTSLLVSRLAGADGRGQFALVAAFGALSLTLGSVGLPEAATVRTVASDDTQRSEIFWLTLILSLPISLVMVGIALVLAQSTVGASVQSHLLVLAGLTPLRSAGLTAVFILLARGRVILHQALMATYAVTTFLALVVFWLVGWDSSSTLSWAAVLGFTVPAAVQLIANGVPQMRFPRADLRRRALGFGVRSWVGAIANTANQRLDLVVLSFLASPSSVGIYANASSVAAVSLVAPSAFGARVRWAASSKSAEGVRRWLKAALVLAAVLGIAGAGGAYFFFAAVFGSEFSDGRSVAAALALVAPLLATSRLLALIVAMADRPATVARAELVGLIIGLVLLIALFPSLGLWAAVVASAFGYGTASALEWRSVRTIGYLRGVDDE